MATDFTSVDVVSGDDILATDLNNLRADVVRRAGDYETAGGSSNAFTLSIDSSISAYAAGQVFRFQANHSITGAATLNVNSIGAQTIKNQYGGDVGAGDIDSGDEVTVIYNGTNMILVSPNKEAVAILSATRAADTASGNQTIAHGLPRTPRYIEIVVTLKTFDSGTDGNVAHSHGYSDGSTHSCSYTGTSSQGGAAANAEAGNSSSYCVLMDFDDAATTDAQQVATASFDASDITLAWTLTGTGLANNMNITIIAHA